VQRDPAFHKTEIQPEVMWQRCHNESESRKVTIAKVVLMMAAI